MQPPSTEWATPSSVEQATSDPGPVTRLRKALVTQPQISRRRTSIPHLREQSIEAFPAVNVQDSQPELPPGRDEQSTTYGKAKSPNICPTVKISSSGTACAPSHDPNTVLRLLEPRREAGSRAAQDRPAAQELGHQRLPQNMSPAPRQTFAASACRKEQPAGAVPGVPFL